MIWICRSGCQTWKLSLPSGPTGYSTETVSISLAKKCKVNYLQFPRISLRHELPIEVTSFVLFGRQLIRRRFLVGLPGLCRSLGLTPNLRSQSDNSFVCGLKRLSNILSAVATPCKFGHACLSSFLAHMVGFAQTPQLDGFECLSKNDKVSRADFRRRWFYLWCGGAMKRAPPRCGLFAKTLASFAVLGKQKGNGVFRLSLHVGVLWNLVYATDVLSLACGFVGDLRGLAEHWYKN